MSVQYELRLVNKKSTLLFRVKLKYVLIEVKDYYCFYYLLTQPFIDVEGLHAKIDKSDAILNTLKGQNIQDTCYHADFISYYGKCICKSASM